MIDHVYTQFKETCKFHWHALWHSHSDINSDIELNTFGKLTTRILLTMNGIFILMTFPLTFAIGLGFKSK